MSTSTIPTRLITTVIESGTSTQLEALASVVPSRAQSLSLRALAAQRREQEEAANS